MKRLTDVSRVLAVAVMLGVSNRVGATSITITNHSFEVDGNSYWHTPTGWSLGGSTADSRAGAYAIADTGGNSGADGTYIGYINGPITGESYVNIFQDTAEIFREGYMYTLEVGMTIRISANVNNIPWKLSLHDAATDNQIASSGGILLVADRGPLVDKGLNYVATAADAGKTIRVRITNNQPTAGGNQLLLDNVRLTVVTNVKTSAEHVLVVEDDFDRPYSELVGTMSDNIHSWYENESPAYPQSVRAPGTTIYMAYASGANGNNVGAAVSDFTLADGFISVFHNWTGSTGLYNKPGIIYRAASLQDASELFKLNYQLQINGDWSGPKDIELWYGHPQTGTLLGTADLGSAWAQTTYEIHVQGTSHTVYVNGGSVPVICAYDNHYTGAGFMGLAATGSATHWDNFQVWGPPKGTVMVVK